MTPMQRRGFLALGSVLLCAVPAKAASPRATDAFAAAWDDAQGRHFVGLLRLGGPQVRIQQSLEVPTRAHGLLVEPGGSVLAMARRPGDWLLRWWPAAATKPQWQWTDADRRVTGHAIASADGQRVFTGEADLDSGAGLVGVRDARTLEKLDEWPSHGIDVHQLLLDANGDLVVANGGVPTKPESGRVKGPTEAMDSSLVRLAGRDGALRGQWRLDDRQLSLRHLAWRGDVLGIALQSEHADATTRAQAPLLARFDGKALTTHAAPEPLSGYGGDIVATRDGWAVSATRRGGVALFDAGGGYRRLEPLPEAGALALRGGEPCIGGRDEVIATPSSDRLALPDLRLDNHWRAFDS